MKTFLTETAMDVYGYIESGFDCIVRYCILALEMVGVRLDDHIIIADDDYVSLSQSGFFAQI